MSGEHVGQHRAPLAVAERQTSTPVGEMLAEYHTVAEQAVIHHHERLLPVVQAHDTAFAAAAADPSVTTAATIWRQTAKQSHDAMLATRDEVAATLKEVAVVFPQLLSPEDRGVLETLETEITQRDGAGCAPSIARIRELLRASKKQFSSSEAYQAARAALDKTVLDRARADIEKYGLVFATEAVQLASSSTARHAMQAALDVTIHDTIVKEARDGQWLSTVQLMSLGQSRMSGPLATQTVRRVLDRYVAKEYDKELQVLGDNASAPQRLLGYLSGGENGVVAQAVRRDARETARNAKRLEAARRIASVAAKETVDYGDGRDKTPYAWLAQADPAEVARVLDAMQEMHRNGMSARSVYSRFRVAIEEVMAKPEADRTEADRQTLRNFEIADALMAGVQTRKFPKGLKLDSPN